VRAQTNGKNARYKVCTPKPTEKLPVTNLYLANQRQKCASEIRLFMQFSIPAISKNMLPREKAKAHFSPLPGRVVEKMNIKLAMIVFGVACLLPIECGCA
jgi:hypothetical protein